MKIYRKYKILKKKFQIHDKNIKIKVEKHRTLSMAAKTCKTAKTVKTCKTAKTCKNTSEYFM